MKTTRRLLAMVLTVIMVMSLATTAFAADGTYTLTLNGAQAGHTYTAYQIFAGDLSGDTLSNIVWGSGVNTAAEGFNLGDAATKAESLKTQADAEAFAAAVAPYLGTAAGSVKIADNATTGTITGLEAGYYLVKTTATPDKDGVYTYYIMKVVKDTTATIKADVPKVEKTVNDNDVNIGDTFTFTLTATMPSDLQGYETYKVVFHDTMSEGISYIGNVKVTVAGVDKTSDFTINHDTATNKLTVSCNDVKALGATASSKIIVTYDAKLNDKAVIGTNGNLNKVYLEYSNNPNAEGEGSTGKTPEAEEKVYTWEIPVFKYTKGEGDAKNPLAGAGFTLYDGETAVKLTKGEGNVYKVDPNGSVTEIVTDSTGEFEIEGLEQGTYVLEETTVPAGYNKCDDVTVTIGENGVLTVGDATVTTVEILNNAGSVLPETGGMGTTLFYILGGILMVGAAVLLVTKRRMNMAE